MKLEKDFLDFETIPDETKEKITKLRSENTEIMIINMFDKTGIDVEFSHFAKNVKIMADWITRGNSQLVHYSDIDKDTAVKKGSNLILFSGKYKGLSEYQKEGSFNNLFGGLIDTIKTTKVPIIGICAGHQLYAMAYDGNVEYIQELNENKKLTIFGKENMPDIILPDHPLYREVDKLTNNLVHYNNNQRVISRDNNSKVLSVKKAPNGKSVIGSFDHVDENDLDHHIITHQYHPEKIFEDIKTQEENPTGLVLLVNSMSLLSNPDKYTKTKKAFYNMN